MRLTRTHAFPPGHILHPHSHCFWWPSQELLRYCSKLGNAKTAGVRSGFLLALSLGLVYMFFYWGYAIAFWFGGKLISEDVKNSFTNKVWTGGDVVIVFFSGEKFPSPNAAAALPSLTPLLLFSHHGPVRRRTSLPCR